MKIEIINKIHSHHSSALGTVSCPKCSKRGQLKKRTNGYGKSYFQVDHYKKGNSHSSGYSHSCYLGVDQNE